jgi:hypothetical protein
MQAQGRPQDQNPPYARLRDPDRSRSASVAVALRPHAQHRLDALPLQLATAQRARRALFESSESRVDVVELEHHAFDPLQARVDLVQPRARPFEQRVQQTSRLSAHRPVSRQAA